MFGVTARQDGRQRSRRQNFHSVVDRRLAGTKVAVKRAPRETVAQRPDSDSQPYLESARLFRNYESAAQEGSVRPSLLNARCTAGRAASRRACSVQCGHSRSMSKLSTGPRPQSQ